MRVLCLVAVNFSMFSTLVVEFGTPEDKNKIISGTNTRFTKATTRTVGIYLPQLKCQEHSSGFQKLVAMFVYAFITLTSAALNL